MNGEILCVGEVLWDALPAGLFLGGAPFNVAYHIHTLGAPVAVVSRVGEDALGREALRRMRQRGISTDLVQVDPELETGFVEVALDRDGIAEYVIVEPVAWDNITLNAALRERAATARAIVYGSLAQRSEVSRNTIRTLCQAEGMKVFDVNLRSPFDSWGIVEPSLRLADVVKLNQDELQQIMAWSGLSDSADRGPAALAARFGCEVVCVTRGPEGAVLWKEGASIERTGYQVEVVDTVGSGDAFLAALLAGLLADRHPSDVLDVANRLGAYVATQLGPTPAYDLSDLDTIEDLVVTHRQ